MAVITTPSIRQTFQLVKETFPNFLFKRGEDFRWSPGAQTIFYKPIKSTEDVFLLLHEVAHGKLGHTTYINDIELIRFETAAWHEAQNKLAPLFNLTIPEDLIEDSLSTYRLWLHNRSLCPDCKQTGMQTQNTYNCINCRCSWRANEARVCRLQRIRL